MKLCSYSGLLCPQLHCLQANVHPGYQEREGVLVGSEAVTSPALSSHTHTRTEEDRGEMELENGRW